MKKAMIFSIVLAMLGLVPATMAQLPISSGECVDLIADGGSALTATDIGEVCVEDDGTTLTVTYNTIGGPWWSLLTTHLYVWGPDDDPPKLVGGGNPVPGQFAWQVPDEETATSATYHIALVGDYPGKGKKVGDHYDWTGEIINIAAHSVVGNGLCDCDLLLEALPETATALIDYPGDECYFDVTISGDGILDGTHKGWCADVEDTIDDPFSGDGHIYSSLCDDIPEGPIDYPGNLDLVNWILNHKDGYTAGDIQYAIWMLLSGEVSDEALGDIDHAITYAWPEDESYDLDRALELIDAAETNGGGFVPGCGEVMAIVFIPPAWETTTAYHDEGDPRQAVLFEFPAPCCETAWGGIATDVPAEDTDENGYGLDFPGPDWSMYFTYQVVSP